LHLGGGALLHPGDLCRSGAMRVAMRVALGYLVSYWDIFSDC